MGQNVGQGCVYCGFDGPAGEWWHEPPESMVGKGGLTAEDRICDLCWNTQANAAGPNLADVIRSTNYVGNRILEALHR